MIAALALAVGGCATAHVAAPLTGPLSGSAPEVQSEFWYQLANRRIASNDEAFHALLLYADGKDPNPTYAGRVAALVARQMLPAAFAGGADDAVDRGTLAVALDRMLHIQGGLTMRVLGPLPRYALRAAVEQGIFPPSSPNQGLSGGQLVGVMQKAEEFERGNPADGPAHLLPDQVHPVTVRSADPPMSPAVAAAIPTGPHGLPLYLDAAIAATAPVGLPAGPVHLKAIVTGIQGDLVEIRAGPTAPWRPARPGMVMREGTEIRTGPKSAIRFLIPADEAFCLDSQGAITLQQAVVDLKKARTRLGLEHGRLREDLSHAAPVQIEQAGVEHDTVIQSPDSALALRGTKVSLFEQPSFEPVAVSLTGQATFTNTAGVRVPFGGDHHVVIVGAQTSAAQQAAAAASVATAGSDVGAQEFNSRELAVVSQRGGFERGDVIVGDFSQFGSDFGSTGNHHLLPGGMDIVLQWTGATPSTLNDLNLAVFSPLNTAASPDFVANPPFTVSLTPTSPASEQLRKTTYPAHSRTGGQISANSVGPDGLELAYWPKTYPTGNYTVVVYDLVDAKPVSSVQVDPVSYTVSLYQNGIEQYRSTGTIGQTQYVSIGFPSPSRRTTPPGPSTPPRPGGRLRPPRRVKPPRPGVATPARPEPPAVGGSPPAPPSNRAPCPSTSPSSPATWWASTSPRPIGWPPTS